MSPSRERNTLDLIITSLPGQFVDIHSPDRLSDHDIVSGTLKVVIPPIEKPKRKMYRYQKGDYESMRKDTLKFAKERYFNDPEIRRKIRKRNETHAKAKKTGSAKIRSKLENLRREIKADIRKQHDLYVNNSIGDVNANPRDFYRYINSQKKDTHGISL